MRIEISGDSQAAILEQLIEVKEDVVTILQPTDVAFEDPIVRATIELLRRVARLNRRTKLTFSNCSGSFELIIQEALSLKLVSAIAIEGCDNAYRPYRPPSAIFPALRWGIQYQHLKAVRFDDIDFSRRQAEFLTTVLIGSNHLKQLSLVRTTFTENQEQEHGISALVAGLQQNTSLEGLELGDLNLIDTHAARIVDALELHQSLRRLELWLFDCGYQTTQALINLLMKNRKLTELEIGGSNPSPPTCIDSIMTSLRGHPCLERLDLANNELSDEDLNLEGLVQILSTCPKLERLSLRYNEFTCDGLEVLASRPLPAALRCLDLTDNYFDEEQTPDHILTILQGNPRLGFVDYDNIGAGSSRQQIEHLMDLNESGKNILLLDNCDVIPFSLWSLVLGRANMLFHEFQPSERIQAKRANVMFHLLQGPALMQRRFDLEASPPSRLGEKRAAGFELQERPQKKQNT
jgi:hypothetical protein